MNVRVNASCVGCGLCASMFPDIFLITDGGTAGGIKQMRTKSRRQRTPARWMPSRSAEFPSRAGGTAPPSRLFRRLSGSKILRKT